MTQEYKKILLRDLCARLSYGVKLKPVGLEDTIISYATLKCISKDDNGDYHFEINDRDIDGNILSYGSFKLGHSVIQYLPYLRPMSSMTEEECYELQELCDMYDPYHDTDPYDDWGIHILTQHVHSDFPKPVNTNFGLVLDWLNAHHFDYRGLIPMGLAIEVTEENNPYKNDF